jgi:hypothetical protein
VVIHLAAKRFDEEGAIPGRDGVQGYGFPQFSGSAGQIVEAKIKCLRHAV